MSESPDEVEALPLVFLSVNAFPPFTSIRHAPCPFRET